MPRQFTNPSNALVSAPSSSSPRVSSRSRLVCLLPVVVVVSCVLVCPVYCQDQRLATFYGAYQRVKALASDTGLDVRLNFKTSASTGLLLAVRLDQGGSNAGYLAVGLRDRQLVTILADGGGANSLGNASTDFELPADAWHEVSVRMMDTDLLVELSTSEDDELYPFTFTLSAPLTVKDMFLGGANSFFSPAFTTLEITRYFTGCLANATFNGRDINFEPKVDWYGMEYGCCPNPEPITWNFVYGNDNSFVFDSRLSHRRFQSGTLSVSFLIRSEHDGMIFYTHDEDVEFAMAVEVAGGRLVVTLANELDHFQAHSLSCEPPVLDGWHHMVSVTVHDQVLECSVDEVTSLMNVSRPSLPPLSIEYHVGSAEVSTFQTNLVLFQSNLETLPSGGMYPSFTGSLQQFRLNGLDISPQSLTSTSPSLSPACPQVTICQQLRDEVPIVQLSQVSLDHNPINVIESETTVVTDHHLVLVLPEDIVQSDALQIIAKSIRVMVIIQPSHGELINISSPHQRIEEFTYSDILNRTVAYRHHGEEIPSDLIGLNITSMCHNTLGEVVTLDVVVTLRNDYPVVTRQGTLSIAMGTRRVIGPDVITVEDEESTDLIGISFTVLSVLVEEEGCLNSCGTPGRIEQAKSPGFNLTAFNQKEINEGGVAFQHFAQFGTSPVTVRLRVSDMSGASINVELSVTPYLGHVTLTRNEPLSVVQGRCQYITPDHLAADTNFNDQNPMLQYTVVEAPEYGRLEIQDQGYWRPVLGPFEGFTQSSVDQNLVRYCHDNSSLELDTFGFHLHSTLLQGGDGNFTINVFAYSDLPQPTVTLTTSPVSLSEGGVVTLTDSVLAVSLVHNVSPPWSSAERVRVGDLGVVFCVTTPPKFGEILVNGEVESSFSLAQLVEGVVTYHHNDSENHTDYITLRVEAENTDELPIQSPIFPSPTNLSFIITPVNDHTPLIETSRISLSEGHFVIVTPDILIIADGDQPPQLITVTILVQDVEWGFFAMSDTATPIVQFTSDDMINKSVYFDHQFNSRLSLNHTITIRASDGERNSEKIIEVAARPLTINVSQVPTGVCIASLDAEVENLTTPLLPGPLLAVEIKDDHGVDPNLLQSMVLRVPRQREPRHGELLLSDELGDTFMLNDISHGLVRYRLDDRENRVSEDTFDVEISYGHSETVTVTFTVCIDPVPVPDLVRVVVNPISVATDASVLIDNETFSAVDSRGNGGEAIWYDITHPPQWGRVTDEHNNTVTSFTQAAIDQSRVLYQHLNRSSSTSLRDYFIFRLCTPYACSGVYNVTVTFSVDTLIVYNHGLRVTEGGKAYITKDRLDAIVPQGSVRFHIFNKPLEGVLILDVSPDIRYENPDFFDIQDVASRSVYYKHSGSESLEDNFAFNVTPTTYGRVSGIFHITVNPINNNQPELTVKEFSVIARTTKNITSNDLFAFDLDSDMNSSLLRYRILVGPNQGVIHFRNDSEGANPLREWYERDVRAGLLAYTHTDQDRVQGIDVMGVDICDRDRCQTELVRIHVFEIQLTVEETLITVDEGGTGTIDDAYLHATSAGDDSLTDTDLKFELISLPRHGTLTLRGVPVTNFTQADLTSAGLLYEHDHSNSVSDSFNFNVKILQHNAVKTSSFAINIDPIDDDPPTLVFNKKPLFVVEGSEIHIISDYITVHDFDTNMNLPTQTNLIEFHIISQPQHGEVYRRQGVVSETFRSTEVFTLYEVDHRSVKYISHPLDERRPDVPWFDSFLVNLTDSENNYNSPYNFTFIILPDIVMVRVSPFTVAEGGSVFVPGDSIVPIHPYLKTQLGCIVVNEPPRNGTLVNTATGQVNVSYFTTADLAQGHIAYHHNDAEKEKDRFTFTYEAHQPMSSSALDGAQLPGQFPEFFMRTSDRVALEIYVDTVNDRGPEIFSAPDTTLVMWAEDCAFLSTRHLDVWDADTPNNKLTYNFTFTLDAYISHINDSNNGEISSFTQEDVVNSIIKLHHRNGERGVMTYTVTDGEFSVSSRLYIEVHQLEIVVLHNNTLTVPMNGEVAITPADLTVGRSNVNTAIPICHFDNSVEYQFETSYGVIVVNGATNADSFTDSDIRNGLVSYRHTRPDIWEPLETVKLKAKATLTKFKDFDLSVVIDLPSEPDSPLAVHRPLFVEEGGTVCLSEAVLDARNIRYNASRETFNKTLTSWFYFTYTDDPHGEILVNGETPSEQPPVVSQSQIANGSVCYRNFGDESTCDLLGFSLIIKDKGKFHWGGGLTGLFLNVSVTLINDEAPVVVSSMLALSVVEGFSAPVWNDSLLIEDEDNRADDLVFSVLHTPQGGQLWLGREDLLGEGDNFTQAAVNEGALGFEAIDVGTWTTLLAFTDGKFENVTNFTVSVEEHFVKVIETDILKYSQNEMGAHLTPKHITTLTNGDLNETIYTVIENPINGELKGLRGDNGYFTQSDLTKEGVSYVPTNFKAHSDFFKLVVSNREARNETVTVEVRVEVWGQVKRITELDFSSADDDKSLPLPKNILQLPELQLLIQRPPVIQITEPPRLGYLEVKVSTDSDLFSKRSSTGDSSPNKFLYDYLDYDWVYYTWNASNVSVASPSECVNDSFSVLVEGYEGVQPGEATITLCLKNPPLDPATPPSTSEEPSTSEPTISAVTPIQEDTGSSGFPRYALLPILGVFLILLAIIIVVIVICVTQQGRIRKRWQPHVLGHNWAARNGTQNLSLQPRGHTNWDPSSSSSRGEAMTSLTGMVDHGATDYPEDHSPILRRSPLSRYSPMTPSSAAAAMFHPPSESGQSFRHHRMIPRPRSRRSNVSVSYSHRPLSEVTLDDLPQGRHHAFSPLPSYMTRGPTSEEGGGGGGEGESGYLSTPAPSVVADEEPVRLVLRRPVVEEVSPLPRVSDEPCEEEEEEENEEEDTTREQGLREGIRDEEEEEEISNFGEVRESEQACFDGSGKSPDASEQIDSEDAPQQSVDQQEDTLAITKEMDSDPHHTPPSSQDAPLLPSSPTLPSDSTQHSTATTSPSDLHTLFRTRNPILKHTEYWV